MHIFNKRHKRPKKPTLETFDVYAEDVKLTRKAINRAAAHYYARFVPHGGVRMFVNRAGVLLASGRKALRKAVSFISNRKVNR